MVIYGVSQSSGVERRLTLDRAGTGVLFAIIDHVGDVERERIIVQTDDIMSALVAPGGEQTVIDGESPASGAKRKLDFVVRRNEIQLRIHDGAGEGADVAVGLDELQDALEKITAAA